jgi:hypothetical protein
MKLEELRQLVSENIGVEVMEEELPDNKLISDWSTSVMWWNKYMTSNTQTTGFTVNDSLSYTFTGNIPNKITGLWKLPSGISVPCSSFFYSRPTIQLYAPLKPGGYSVTFCRSLDWQNVDAEEMSSNPRMHPLLQLFVASVKQTVGQFLKFSGYQDKPFDIDGEAWYREGTEDIKTWREFIMINRDERFSNITNFNVNRTRLGV